MHSGQAYKDRVQALREGFRQADEARGAMYGDERTFNEKAGETALWAKRAFVDQYAPVRQVLTGEDASYAINRAIYSGSEKELYTTEMFQRVTSRLQDAGLTADDLGEYARLWFKRTVAPGTGNIKSDDTAWAVEYA